VRQRGRQLVEPRSFQLLARYGLDVDVAAQRIEVTKRTGPDQPRALQSIAQPLLEATRQLGEVGR
jgi:hypothetical protein